MAMSFQEALNLAKNSEKNVLLGNGFSIACNDVFNYGSLLQNANIEDSVRSVFTNLNTADFEIIIEKFESAALLLEMYANNGHAELIENLRSVSQELKNELARVILSQHVSNADAFRLTTENGVRRQDCFHFLANFSQIFTTNYDLLLYWSIMRYFEWRRSAASQDGILIPTNDGFTRPGEGQPLRYVGGIDQNVFYLHGSLFIFQDGYDILKMERDSVEGLNLLPIISHNITERNILPLIVLEGGSVNKLLKISEHFYLNNALANLSDLSGSLFIHGHSLDQSDQHIFDAINHSVSLDKIFISVVIMKIMNLKTITIWNVWQYKDLVIDKIDKFICTMLFQRMLGREACINCFLFYLQV